MVALKAQPFYLLWSATVLGLSPQDFNQKSDGFESMSTFLLLSFHIFTMGFVLSFGGNHRQRVWQNWRLCLYCGSLVAVWGVLILGQNTILHGVFRVNCDSSAIPHIYNVPPFAGMSHCILGPQMAHWGQGSEERLKIK